MSELTPNISRRTVNQAMARRGMRSVVELAQGKPCGTRLRYYAGCRCDDCRRANTEYERERNAARKRGETNRIVSAERARQHLAHLSRLGVGRKTAADAAKVASSVVADIATGRKTKIREQTERRLLAVTETTAADGARTQAAQTWRMLDELIAAGYPKRQIASEIAGRPMRSLQISRSHVVVRTAAQVLAAYERMRLAEGKEAAIAHDQLREMREEAFRLDRIQREVDSLAAARGWPAPSIDPKPQGGRWPGPARLTHRAAVLIGAVHAALVGVDEVEQS